MWTLRSPHLSDQDRSDSTGGTEEETPFALGVRLPGHTAGTYSGPSAGEREGDPSSWGRGGEQ